MDKHFLVVNLEMIFVFYVAINCSHYSICITVSVYVKLKGIFYSFSKSKSTLKFFGFDFSHPSRRIFSEILNSYRMYICIHYDSRRLPSRWKREAKMSGPLKKNHENILYDSSFECHIQKYTNQCDLLPCLFMFCKINAVYLTNLVNWYFSFFICKTNLRQPIDIYIRQEQNSCIYVTQEIRCFVSFYCLLFSWHSTTNK